MHFIPLYGFAFISAHTKSINARSDVQAKANSQNLRYLRCRDNSASIQDVSMEIAKTTELPGKGKRCGCSKRTEERTDVRVCIKIYAGILVNAYGFRFRKEGKQADGLQPPCTAIAITVSYRPFLSENHLCVGMRRSLPEGLTLFPFS